MAEYQAYYKNGSFTIRAKNARGGGYGAERRIAPDRLRSFLSERQGAGDRVEGVFGGKTYRTLQTISNDSLNRIIRQEAGQGGGSGITSVTGQGDIDKLARTGAPSGTNRRAKAAAAAAAQPTTAEPAPTGGEGFSMVQTGTDVAPSPVLEVMAEQRARREASRQAAQNQLSGMLTAIPKFAPRGATTFPGMEHGGLADIMMGILSGQGVAGAQGLIPETTRQPGIQEIPASLFEAIGAAEPSMASDFGGASSIAAQILGQMLRLPRFSPVSTGGAGSAGSDAGLDSIIAALSGGA